MKTIISKISFCFFLSLTSFTLISQSIDNPKIKWRFKTQGTIRGSSVVAQNKIYFGSADGFVYALNQEDGSLVWKKSTGSVLTSTPMIANSSLYIANRDGLLYSMNAETGKVDWKFKMQPILPDLHAGWDYFMASPVMFEKYVLIGSGDGHLYALDSSSGQLQWKFRTTGRIRATPLVYAGHIYQPSNDGYIYVLEGNSGKLLWKFETRGAAYNPDDFNFDRSSICTKPIIHNNTLYVGSRDGNAYAIDLERQKEKWNFSYGTTWAMSTTIADDMILVGWSTNNLTSALDLKSGTEKWQFESLGHVYTKPLVIDGGVYIGSADGNIYRLNKESGEKIWEYSIGSEIYSSIIHDRNTLFFGSDDGFFYALENTDRIYSAVYQPPKIEGKAQYLIVDQKITPYLVEKGFEQLDEERLFRFIADRIKDKAPSVIVFNFPIVPSNVVGVRPEEGMMRKYLTSGGRVIWLGDVPNFYELDDAGNFKRDPSTGSKMLGVSFLNPTDSGNYYGKTTQQGLNLGLPMWMKTTGSIVSPEGVVPLVYDEFGRINTWMKKFNKIPGSGFISCRPWAWNVPIREQDLDLIYQLAIYTLK